MHVIIIYTYNMCNTNKCTLAIWEYPNNVNSLRVVAKIYIGNNIYSNFFLIFCTSLKC